MEEHVTPYFTPYLFFPKGASLVFHTHSPFNQLVALPINILWGPTAAYNFSILLGIALSGFAAYLLARELTGDNRAAFVAGLIFAFFPYHLEQTLEHTNLATMQFLPLSALYLLRVLRRGGIANSILLGLFFALNALGSWHYGVLSLLFLPILLISELLTQHAENRGMLQRRIGPLIVSIFTAFVIMGPFLWPLLKEIASGSSYIKHSIDRGIDMIFLFLPSDHHPLLGQFTRDYYLNHRTYIMAGFLCYIGFTPLFLAFRALPLVFKKRRILIWIIIGIAFLLLSLGANPLVGGKHINIPFPHALLSYLPLFNVLRTANRFFVIAMLALSLLSAWGLAELRRRKKFWTTLAIILVIFEYLWIPFPIQQFQSSPYLATLAEERDSGAVINIPFSNNPNSSQNMAYQTIHCKPIPDGYVSIWTHEQIAMIKDDPILGHLYGFDPEVPEQIDKSHLKALGFSTVILQKDRTKEYLTMMRESLGSGADFYKQKEFFEWRGIPQQTFARISERFEEVLGPPVYEDNLIRVFKIR